MTEWDLRHAKKAAAAVANAAEMSESGRGLRASRRIAQNKIKEEAERRAIEEATIASMKDMKKKKKVLTYFTFSFVFINIMSVANLWAKLNFSLMVGMRGVYVIYICIIFK